MVRFFCSGWQFLFSSKIVLTMSWLMKMSQLLHKRRCRRVAAKLLFGRGRPAKQQLRRLCWRFGNYFFAFFFNFSAPTTLPKKGWKIWYYDWISVFWYRGDIFWWKKSKDTNWSPGGVHLDFRIWTVSKVSLFEMLESCQSSWSLIWSKWLKSFEFASWILAWIGYAKTAGQILEISERQWAPWVRLSKGIKVSVPPRLKWMHSSILQTGIKRLSHFPWGCYWRKRSSPRGW